MSTRAFARCEIPLLLLAGAFIAGSAQAAGADSARTEIFDSAYLMQVIGSLLLVFGCLFGLAFVMKKMGGVPTGDRKSLRVIGSVKVGSREKIVLLDTGENQVLVGVAAGNVRTLYVYDSSESPSDKGGDEPESSPHRTSADFASLMPSADVAGAKA